MSNLQARQDIIQVCDRIKALLLSKNEKYGDAALNPTRIMSKANAVEQILIRIDDKLNRISKGAGLLASDEDVVQDLAGYFILLIIALERQNETNFETVKQIIDGATASGQPYKGLDQAWDKEDDSPSYVGRVDQIPMPARLLSTDECREMGLPVTPQVNWNDGPEPELDEEPGVSGWINRQSVGLRKGPIDVIQSGEGVGRSQLEKDNEATLKAGIESSLKAWEKLVKHQREQLGIPYPEPVKDGVPSEPPEDQDENKIEDPWKAFRGGLPVATTGTWAALRHPDLR